LPVLKWRFDEVADLIARSGFKLGRRSEIPPSQYDNHISALQPSLPSGEETPANPHPLAEVILLDSIGELADVYRHATVVFVGQFVQTTLRLTLLTADMGQIAISAGYVLALVLFQLFYFLRPGTRLRSPVSYAILPVQGSTYVWVVKDGKADRRQVTLGVRTAGWAEIQGGGIDAGDQVVVGGAERLFPGAPLMPQVVERHRGAPTGAESTAAAAPRASSKSP